MSFTFVKSGGMTMAMPINKGYDKKVYVKVYLTQDLNIQRPNQPTISETVDSR